MGLDKRGPSLHHSQVGFSVAAKSPTRSSTPD